ncbi:hypothetical protein [Companilactobacillus bobalius]|uniref:Uncharacterized protein n=2 Tax=Companilactobacillus bobalius TaxID=2801451 RepID=A0A202FAQ3_9LACO|nr:hypothetical protein [Companilactobacillus bobalius]KAE9562484.1 hypothetical protein ATN92_04125 [Companilactobacillus bobalius]OVE97545.1 hypothetical protein LKACC16343_01426 [Companilactobacillus bobalius]GEO57844.1 cell surface protein [Companilactobacillus paralimentarius]
MNVFKNSVYLPMSIFIAILFSVIIFSLTTTTLTSADETQQAIDGAPAGLDIQKFFNISPPLNTVTDNPFLYNYARTAKDGKVLDLADGSGKYGAAWSDTSAGNYLDIRKDQTVSAWLYFGAAVDNELLNGQGMALVLQNDPRGYNAMGAGYQGLGVYGYDKGTTSYYYLTESKPTVANPDYIASTAVKNSMALEFDSQKNDAISQHDESPTQVNFVPGGLRPGTYYYTLSGYDTRDTANKNPIPSNYPENSQFGAGGGYGHIAVTYPGLASSYALLATGAQNQVNSAWKGFTTAASVIHSGTKAAQLVDAGTDENPIYWHHVTFTWKHAENGESAQIKYAFNDKYLDGTINNDTTTLGGYPRVDQTVKVDPSIFGNIKDNKLYWGFTGANGRSTGVYSKLVVFESIPALVHAEAKTSITDHTLEKVITDDSTDQSVAHGDKLTIDYNVNYDTENSRADWNKISADIDLPTNINYTPDNNGNIATINYTNSLNGNTKTEYISGTNLTDQALKFKLAENLGKVSNTAYTNADIVINGIADNTTDHDIDVPEKPAKFSGENQISTTSTPEFTVTYQKNWLLNFKNPDPIDIVYNDADEKLNLPTQLSYDKNHHFKKDDPIRYDISVAGKTYTGSSQANSTDTSATGTIPLRSIIGNDFWNIFKEKTTQKITVMATDKDDIKSNTVTYTVNVLQDKFLDVNASKDLDFQDINYLSTNKYLKRKSGYSVSVTSLRNPWKLSVSTSAIKKGDINFNGILVYKKKDGTTYDLTSDEVPIAENDVVSDQLVTTVISKDWTDDTGPLLKQTGVSESGKYSGLVTWHVTNSI